MAKSAPARVLLILALVASASVAVNVLQGRRILTLQDALDELSVKGDLPAGARAAPLDATDVRGQPARLTFGGAEGPTVLYVFRPSCPWCEKNSPGISRLVNEIGKSYRVIGISLSADSVAEFVAEHKLTFPVFTNVSAKGLRLYKLGTTPETIVVSSAGTILASWKGAYVGRTKSDIEKFFSIRLPDV